MQGHGQVHTVKLRVSMCRNVHNSNGHPHLWLLVVSCDLDLDGKNVFLVFFFRPKNTCFLVFYLILNCINNNTNLLAGVTVCLGVTHVN